MSSEIAIKVENLSKCYQIYSQPRDRLKQFILPRLQEITGQQKKTYYEEFWALKEITFEIKKGESLGIVGRNGSGKSTLLQIITGTLTPTTGNVITTGRVSALLELGSGFNPEFTGKENVFLNAALQGFTSEETENRFEEIAAFADIGKFLEQPVKTYSSGMYARLAFSSAIHCDPNILIVDEILAVGDTPFQQKCLGKLYKMLDDGVSVLLVSHDAYQVRSVCGKALFLQKGKQVLFDSSDKVMDEYVASFGQENFDKCNLLNSSEDVIESNDEVIEFPKKYEFSISIKNPSLSSRDIQDINEVESRAPVQLEFDYEILGIYQGNLSFVINLYREDGVYVFGTTTIMQGLAPFPAESGGHVRINFPTFPLVSGKYKWRVAVNDERGMGIISEAVPVCQFRVIDDFKVVGIFDIPHTWSIDSLKS